MPLEVRKFMDVSEERTPYIFRAEGQIYCLLLPQLALGQCGGSRFVRNVDECGGRRFLRNVDELPRDYTVSSYRSTLRISLRVLTEDMRFNPKAFCVSVEVVHHHKGRFFSSYCPEIEIGSI
jgi:hypothetical protein